jgi:hypothetical protein
MVGPLRDPETVAGARLLSKAERNGWYRGSIDFDYARRTIANIEDEARQQEREALAERIEAVFDHDGHLSECAYIRYPGNYMEPPDPCTCGGDAVLSILRGEKP